jgi:hypothetical protein
MIKLLVTTKFGVITTIIIYIADSNENNRTSQDIGFDGLGDAQEAASFSICIFSSSEDNYNYFKCRRRYFLI